MLLSDDDRPSLGPTHEIEIWFGVIDSSLYLISGNGPTADWYQNIVAHPEVTVHIGHETRAGRASVVTDPEERHRVGDVMGAKYVWEKQPWEGRQQSIRVYLPNRTALVLAPA